MEIAGNVEVFKLIPIHQEHILVMCKDHPMSENEGIETIDGEWFGSGNHGDNLSLLALSFTFQAGLESMP